MTKAWRKTIKIFAESTETTWVEDKDGHMYMYLAVSSGEESYVFVFSPAHLKQFSQMISHHMGAYEKEKGVVNIKWEPSVPSPFINGSF